MLVVNGVVLWSILSLIFRFVGLPEGPLGVLGFTQSLSYEPWTPYSAIYLTQSQ